MRDFILFMVKIVAAWYVGAIVAAWQTYPKEPSRGDIAFFVLSFCMAWIFSDRESDQAKGNPR